MINIRLTRSQAEYLLEINEKYGNDLEIMGELKISLGMIKPNFSELENEVEKQLKKLFESASIK
jgi:hypothetical protein